MSDQNGAKGQGTILEFAPGFSSSQQGGPRTPRVGSPFLIANKSADEAEPGKAMPGQGLNVVDIRQPSDTITRMPDPESLSQSPFVESSDGINHRRIDPPRAASILPGRPVPVLQSHAEQTLAQARKLADASRSREEEAAKHSILARIKDGEPDVAKLGMDQVTDAGGSQAPSLSVVYPHATPVNQSSPPVSSSPDIRKAEAPKSPQRSATEPGGTDLRKTQTLRRTPAEARESAAKLRRNLGVWLASAGPDELGECTEAEQRKVSAVGYTVLVPTIFSLMAASYAVSTLTPNVFIITVIAIAWAAIILFVDRAIIATHSPFMVATNKAMVVTLRLAIAVLMGLTVSHPLTLLLFDQTIDDQIAKTRAADMAELRDSFAEQKKAIEGRMAVAQSVLDKQNADWDATFDPKFLRDAEQAVQAPVAAGLTAEEQAVIGQRTEEAAKPLREELAGVNTRVQETQQKKNSLQAEIDHWQREFEAEINGSRSGAAGLGPQAKNIEKIQLEPRRGEMERINQDLSDLGTRRTQIERAIASSGDTIRRDTENAAAARAQSARIAQEAQMKLQSEMKARQAQDYVKELDTRRLQLKEAIASAQADKDRLSAELAGVGDEEKRRLADMEANPRKDLLAKTLALHHLFEKPEEGGHFALIAYLVLAGLFLAIDTMPILVKFTSRVGTYDTIREMRFIPEQEDLTQKQQILERLHQQCAVARSAAGKHLKLARSLDLSASAADPDHLRQEIIKQVRAEIELGIAIAERKRDEAKFEANLRRLELTALDDQEDNAKISAQVQDNTLGKMRALGVAPHPPIVQA